jgi:hypothetical protein
MIVWKDEDSQLRKSGFIKGLYLGGIILVLSICSFYYITTMVTSPWAIMIGSFSFSTIIPLVVTIFFVLNMRKDIGGYWTFRQAVTGIFIMLFTNYVLLTIGRDVLFGKLIEHDMIQKTEAVMIRSSTVMYKSEGLPQAQINSKIAELKKGFDDESNMTVFKLISGYLLTVILLFVVTIFLAAVFKREGAVLVVTEEPAE